LVFRTRTLPITPKVATLIIQVILAILGNKDDPIKVTL
jgi:hypothetical protein